MKRRCKSFATKHEAEKWARDLEARVDRVGAAPDTKILESTTLGQLLERYQSDISPLKRGSVQEIQRLDVLRRHDLAYRTLVGLSQQDIASFRDERLQSVAPSTTVRELAILSHVLEVAMRDWGLPLSKNVVKQVRRPVIRNERSSRLTLNEEQRLLDACDTGKRPFLRTLLIVAIETGMRRDELLGLEWSDFSRNRRVLSLTRGSAECGKPDGEHIAYNQRVLDLLGRIPNVDLIVADREMERAYEREVTKHNPTCSDALLERYKYTMTRGAEASLEALTDAVSDQLRKQ